MNSNIVCKNVILNIIGYYLKCLFHKLEILKSTWINVSRYFNSFENTARYCEKMQIIHLPFKNCENQVVLNIINRYRKNNLLKPTVNIKCNIQFCTEAKSFKFLDMLN